MEFFVIFDTKIINVFESNNNGTLSVINTISPLMVTLYILVHLNIKRREIDQNRFIYDI